MLDRGFLAGKGFYVTFAHQDEHVDAYLTAVREVFSIVGDAIRGGRVQTLLRGPIAHSGFARLT
jgi:glutamate-1-semialdehyde 2,1-aminomutase